MSNEAALRQKLQDETLPRFVRHEIEPISRFFGQKNRLNIVDIGANIGVWSKSFLMHFGERVEHLWLVEPQAHNVGRMKRREGNLLFTPAELDRITIVPCAAGSGLGEATIFSDVAGSPLGSLYSANVEGEGKTVSAQTITVVPTHVIFTLFAIEHADMVKIDAEGHDLQVLIGAKELIEAGRIDVIQFEFGSTAVAARTFFKDYWDLLTALGYEIYLLPRFDDKPPLIKVQAYTTAWEKFTGNPTFVARPLRKGRAAAEAPAAP